MAVKTIVVRCQKWFFTHKSQVIFLTNQIFFDISLLVVCTIECRALKLSSRDELSFRNRFFKKKSKMAARIGKWTLTRGVNGKLKNQYLCRLSVDFVKVGIKRIVSEWALFYGTIYNFPIQDGRQNGAKL